MTDSIDLTPSPRVLRMLGEIDFKAWQCLCEIIDNSIDAFNSSTLLLDEGVKPTIKVKLPAASQNQIKSTDQLIIEDNAEGMTINDLSKSLKAGFSANNPVDKMGLFGMGFNISTARLGNRTEVITTTKESDDFLKVTIDFQELEEKGHFHAPVEKIPKKADEKLKHGTKIIITKLRTDHIRPLYQRKNISKKLGKIYGRILREKEIKLFFAGTVCTPFKHCVWSEFRNGQSKDGPVPAIIKIDHLIDKKNYCSTCWVWLDEGETVCPACNESSAITKRERRIKGWIGIQRYFHADHYGIDLIRNGRVITELDKSFFYWLNLEQEMELEYPIDGHQRLGRIVGELEIDFVKVTHQKDAFDKNTQDWRDVVLAARGDGPIRPQIAKSNGFAENTSPVAKLFSAFRTAKAGIKNLVPQRRNGQAMITDAHIDELVRRFKENETEYQSDEKWWALLNEAHSSDDNKTDEDDPTGGDPFARDDSDSEEEKPDIWDGTEDKDKEKDDNNQLKVTPDMNLSKNYTLEDLFRNVSIRVIASKALEGEHENGFYVLLKGVELEFTYWPDSSVFKNSLLTPADFLINELSYHMHSIAQNEVSRTPITAVELALREKYFSELHPTVEELHRQVNLFTEDLSDHLRSKIGEIEFNVSVIDEKYLSVIKKKMAKNESLDDSQAEDALKRGEFMSYAPFNVVKAVTCEHPQLVFDGVFFRQKWPKVNEQVSPIMESLKNEMETLFMDLEWFSENSGPSGNLWKSRAKRLVGSMEILINWRM